MSESTDVKKFQAKFGQFTHTHPVHVTRRKLHERLECMREELTEFMIAIAKQDLAEQADALIDLVYFAKGTANMLGLPWKELWDDVHQANLMKERGVGKRGHKVDCVKPKGWQPPKTMEILLAAGYNRDEFTRAKGGEIDERMCHDDTE